MYDVYDFYEDILWNTDCLTSSRANEISISIYRFGRKWGNYIYENLFVPILATSKCDTEVAVCIEIKRVGGVGKLYRTHNAFREDSFYIMFPERRVIPTDIPPEFSDLAEWSFIDSLILFDHPKWHEMKRELIAHNDEYRKAIELRSTICETIKKIIKHYGTINEVVAVWPAFRYLLPDHLQTQDLAFDGTPKPLPEGVDVAELTALITRAKLMEV